MDVNENYFYMSFRFNKTKPQHFNLKISSEEKVYISTLDGSKWKQSEMYDFGWGNEYGFYKLPKLNFNELWNLLINSNIEENVNGAAHFILVHHPNELKNQLLNVLNNISALQNKLNFIRAIKILKVLDGINISGVFGKTLDEIRRDYSEWKWIGEKSKELISGDRNN